MSSKSFNKNIEVYDDVFNFQYRHSLLQFLSHSSYKIGWEDGTTVSKDRDKFLHCYFSDNDVKTSLFFENLANTPIIKHIEGRKLERTVCSLITSSDSCFIHTHSENLVLLYYANLEWHNGWHGETLFYDDFGKEIIFTSPYSPGRIILFDGSIPHVARPQSTHATKFRFTFSMFFT